MSTTEAPFMTKDLQKKSWRGQGCAKFSWKIKLKLTEQTQRNLQKTFQNY